MHHPLQSAEANTVACEPQHEAPSRPSRTGASNETTIDDYGSACAADDRRASCVRRDDGIAGADWCLVTWNGLTGWVSQVGLMPVTPQPTQPVARSAASKDDGGI